MSDYHIDQEPSIGQLVADVRERDAEIERLRDENARMRFHFDKLGGERNLLELLDLYHDRKMQAHESGRQEGAKVALRRIEALGRELDRESQTTTGRARLLAEERALVCWQLLDEIDAEAFPPDEKRGRGGL